MIKRSDIVAIVVLYNPNKAIIENVKKYNELLNKTVVVDNSTKNNSDCFSNLEHIDYVALKGNKGIAYALNVGIKRTNEKYIITMDQDSIISDALIKGYLKFLKDYDSEDVGALTPVYDTDRHPGKASTGYKEIALSMQSGTLFKRNLFNRIGYFKEDFFIEVIDYEYFLRMKINGYKLIRINSVVLKHHPAVTAQKNFLGFKLKYGITSPVRIYYKARNLFWTAKKYNSLDVYRSLTIAWLKILFLFKNKKTYFRYFNKGIKDEKIGKFGKYKC